MWKFKGIFAAEKEDMDKRGTNNRSKSGSKNAKRPFNSRAQEASGRNSSGKDFDKPVSTSKRYAKKDEERGKNKDKRTGVAKGFNSPIGGGSKGEIAGRTRGYEGIMRGKKEKNHIEGTGKARISPKNTFFDKKKAQKDDRPVTGNIRLNRYIANAGICSRREADELITAGVVSVNGIPVTEMGYQVKPADEVRYNGQLLSREKKVYLLLNKPKDVITTFDDPEGRRTVMQLFGNELGERVYPVGRLDRNTTGVLLFTNDGDMAQRLMHPKYQMAKVYKATLNKNFKGEDLWELQNGIELEDGFIKPDGVAIPDPKHKNEVGIEIHSGKNRIIHRIFEHLGYKVDKLDRALYAGLTKGKLKRGEWRHLTEKEVNALKRVVKL